MTSPAESLIVALDFPTADKALALIDRLDGSCRWFKVGLELYIAEGRPFIEKLRGQGYSVFLDLKLHDIPNTVAGAVRSAAATGAQLLTVHAGGGPVMLNAAAEAANGQLEILAVTVLTSMDTPQLAATGVPQSPADQVMLLGKMAIASRANGLICSPQEVVALRQTLGTTARLVVPGIRPANHSGDDQSRTATAFDTIRSGASQIVVGRPITGAADPAAAAHAILEEIRKAQS